MGRVLVTGMSGTGKSTALAELGRRGFRVVDTDSPAWSEWVPAEGRPAGEWLWREDRIGQLLTSAEGATLYVSGCMSNQGKFYDRFDAIVLLSAPAEVILDRVESRTTNDWGKAPGERELILSDLASVEPLLRATCTHEIDASRSLDDVVDELIAIGREKVVPPPTVFPDLNELLGELVARVESILGDNLVGAYLIGSFALGGADLHSDCDFLVVTEQRVTAEQERALRKLHDEIPTRSGHWPHDLEGSYAPRAELETLAGLDKPWLYVNRGRREMQWSTHCNTEDVRWTLRERGVTLAGPDPRGLVREVPADALRSRMRPLIESFLPDLFTWTSFDIAWTQRYAVATLCRMLYTLDTGEVASKPASLEWAKHALPPAWHDLIQQVLDDRELRWDEPPRPGTVEPTISFAEYAKARAADPS